MSTENRIEFLNSNSSPVFLSNKHVSFIFFPEKNPTKSHHIQLAEVTQLNIFKVLRTEKSSASRWKGNDTPRSSTMSCLRIQHGINSNPLKKGFFVKVRTSRLQL